MIARPLVDGDVAPAVGRERLAVPAFPVQNSFMAADLAFHDHYWLTTAGKPAGQQPMPPLWNLTGRAVGSSATGGMPCEAREDDPADVLVLAGYGAVFASLAAWRYRTDQARPLG
jgi:hypothetical protein